MSVTSLIDLLDQTGLLLPSHLEEARLLRGHCANHRALGQELIRRGWLTPYQVNLLVAGRANELVLGPFHLLDRIGKGAYGQIFKARHHKFNRLVAVKILQPDLLKDSDVVQRFHREIEVASQLSHPNIVRAYESGPMGGKLVLVMEYVEGHNLEELVGRSGPMLIAQACNYIRQAAVGLQYAHERGLIHRDIKPSNLLVSHPESSKGGLSYQWGRVKILDLGLARLLEPARGSTTGNLTVLGGNSVMQGSPDYMSPEQALDFHTADIRSDIYSLGCTLFFLLAGHPPFPARTLAEKLMKHQQAPPPIEELPQIPPELRAALTKILAKRSADRFQKPQEIVDALQNIGADRRTEVSIQLADIQPEQPGSVPASKLINTAPAKSAGTGIRPLVSKPTMVKRRQSKAIPLAIAGVLLFLGVVAGGVVISSQWNKLPEKDSTQAAQIKPPVTTQSKPPTTTRKSPSTKVSKKTIRPTTPKKTTTKRSPPTTKKKDVPKSTKTTKKTTPKPPTKPLPMKKSVATLIKELGSPDPKIRARAIQALGKRGDKARPALAALVRVLDDDDQMIRQQSYAVLQQLGPPGKGHLLLLIECLKYANATAKLYALDALAQLGSQAGSAVPSVIQELKHKNARIRLRSAKTLGAIGPAANEAIPNLIEGLKDRNPGVRAACAAATGQIGPASPAGMPRLFALVGDDNQDVRSLAILVLEKSKSFGENDPKSMVPHLAKSLADEKLNIRYASLVLLERIGPEAAGVEKSVVTLLDDKNPKIQAKAFDAIAAMGPAAKAAIPKLIAMLGEPKRQTMAIKTLARIGKPAVTKLIVMLGEPKRQKIAMDVLTKIGEPAVFPLVSSLGDRRPAVRIAAIEILTRMGPKAKGAIPGLRLRMKVDSRAEIRQKALLAIKKIESNP